MVLPNPCPLSYGVDFGTVRLGPFDPKSILYWAERAGSAYPVKLAAWSGSFCIQRQRFFTKLIDWESPSARIHAIRKKWGELMAKASILDSYYQSLYRHHLREIPTIVRRHLQIYESAGMMSVDIDELLATPFSQNVGLFSWKRRGEQRGWALMGFPGFQLNYPPANLASECEDWITSDLNYTKGTEYALKPSIDSYCDFLLRAQKHYESGRLDDAFLHFMISLDLLLGEENNSADSVSTRVAILVHRQFDQPREKLVAEVKALYRQRSKYVHDGQQIDSQSVESIDRICCEVLWTVLAAAGANRSIDLDSWLKQIEYIGASLEVAKDIDQSVFTLAGIPQKGHERNPPSKIVHRTDRSSFIPYESAFNRTKLTLMP